MSENRKRPFGKCSRVFVDSGRQWFVLDGMLAWFVVDDEKARRVPEVIYVSWREPMEKLDAFAHASPAELTGSEGPCLVPGSVPGTFVDARLLVSFDGGACGQPADPPPRGIWSMCVQRDGVFGLASAMAPEPFSRSGEPGTLLVEEGRGERWELGQRVVVDVSHPSGTGDNVKRVAVTVGDPRSRIGLVAASLKPGCKKLVGFRSDDDIPRAAKREAAKFSFDGKKYMVLAVSRPNVSVTRSEEA